MPRSARLVAALLAMSVVTRLPADEPASHDDAFSKDGLIKANVADLKDTQLVAHPDAPIPPNQNVIWCGTLQLAWNEAIKLVGEKLQFVNQPPVVDLLNQQDFTRADLDPASYVAIADFERNHVEAEIRAALEKTFHGAASPELIPPVPRHPGLDDFVAYAYLFKNLQFTEPFLDGDPITFGTTQVQSFGFTGKASPLRDKLASQVTICSYNSPDDFVIKLKTRASGDELILAKVPAAGLKLPAGPNLLPTLNEVDARSTAIAGPVGRGDILAVPKLNIDLSKNFTDLEGLTLQPGPNTPVKNLVTTEVKQLVRFQLNEKGAVLKSEATIAVAALAIARPLNLHIMVFDKPFLILMKQARAPRPYFALWVGNASLLVPAK